MLALHLSDGMDSPHLSVSMYRPVPTCQVNKFELEYQQSESADHAVLGRASVM